MIFYNITVKIEPDVHDQWLAWMKETHINKMIATGCFQTCRFCRVLGQNEDDGITYSIQYLAPSIKDLHQYQIHYATKLQQEHLDKFEGKFVIFQSMMELEQEFSTL